MAIGAMQGEWRAVRFVSDIMPKTKGTIKKPPSAKQLAARAKFTKMVKARAAARRAGSPASARRRNVEQGFVDATGFHPIRASRDYARRTGESSRGRGYARKGAKTKTRRRNQLGPAILTGIGSALGGKLVEEGAASSQKGKKNPNFSFGALFGKKRKAAPARKAGSRYSRIAPAQHARVSKAHFGAARAKALREIKFNPGGQHIPGLAPRYQRMYEDIVTSPRAQERYGSRVKSVAAATVKKAAAAGINPADFKRANPYFFGKITNPLGLPRPASGAVRGRFRRHRQRHAPPRKGPFSEESKFRSRQAKTRKTKKGSQRSSSKLLRDFFHPKKYQRYSKPPRKFNPQSPASIFSEFRGRAPDGKVSTVKAAGPNGLVKNVAELGRLIELRLRGRTLKGFPASARLTADSRKKLHIVGVDFKTRGHAKWTQGEKDMGPVLAIVYKADKPHIDPNVIEYKHKFGEEGGALPHLIIDHEGYPVLEGGSYGITADGILN